ncbi:hypothetical protein HDU93_009444 [Gonapodya sp. JEL0774]|nr:hypothetical protein HDU93_009444 [Gonapodya sp. JEL0774]
MEDAFPPFSLSSHPRYPPSPSIPSPTHVTRVSLTDLVPVLTQLLSRDDLALIALDTEFSGMGSGPGSSVFREKNVQQRYQQIRGIVMGHALVGLGLTVVIREHNASGNAVAGKSAEIGAGKDDKKVGEQYLVVTRRRLFRVVEKIV